MEQEQYIKPLLIHFIKKGKCSGCNEFLCDCAEHNWQWFDLVDNIKKYFIDNKLKYEPDTNLARHILDTLLELSMYTMDQALNGIELDADNECIIESSFIDRDGSKVRRETNCQYEEKDLVHDDGKTYYHNPYASLLF